MTVTIFGGQSRGTMPLARVNAAENFTTTEIFGFVFYNYRYSLHSPLLLVAAMCSHEEPVVQDHAVIYTIGFWICNL
jgi:hypothetical protein